MSEQRRRGCGCGSGNGSAAVTARAALEDMPMTRYVNPIPLCSCRQACQGACCGASAEELGQILEALACQNQLLADLLGAVNSLTATLLAERGRSCL